ncbi:MAG: hypothetical protein IJ420_07630 [Lachnospiraceae bacterium]|nr:hypothetical protein [Lachnospiraceae bacterium]
MRKKWMKIAALVAALIIIAGLCWFANALVGNPVSKWLATRTAEKHLEEVYGGTDFEIEKIGFNFKDTDYYAHIKSPSSEDSSFSLRIDMFGNLMLDTYESRVLTGNNTQNRLYMEYRALADTVLEAPDYPFTSFIAYGDLHVGFWPADVELPADYYPEHYYIIEELVLDKKYDIRELAKKAGCLVVYVEDDVVTVERAAEVLLELKEVFDRKNVPFYSIDFVLEYPRKPEGGTTKEGRVNVEGFLYSDIYEEGLVERVRMADEKLNAYYEEQDKITKELVEQMEAQENE